MPTITPTITRLGERGMARSVVWAGLATGDDGGWVELPEHADARSVQVIGTFAGATVSLEGSNQDTPTVSAPLTNAAGAAIALTAAGLARVSEPVRWVRPVVTSGTATGLTVAMFCR